jgi:hypothetical protein
MAGNRGTNAAANVAANATANEAANATANEAANATANEAASEAVTNETETSTELAVQPTGNPFAGFDFADAGFSEEELATLTGMDQIGMGEIRIPYAELISKVTATGLKVGDISFADGTVISGIDRAESVEDLSVLKVQPVRVMFPTPFNPNNGFICRSIDGIVGHTDGEYAGQECATCPMAVYPTGGGASPCRDQRLLLLTNPEGGLFHIQVAGVGIGIWKTFMSAQLFHLLPKARRILGAFKIKMSVKMVNTNFGPFPALDFSINPKDPFVSPERLRANLTSYKAYKEFEQQYTESAALQSKAAMAAGQDAETTVNSKLF